MGKYLGLNFSVFEDFVVENRIYVDKTKIIHTLITNRNCRHFYFFTRPRRFGKSLFISTLKALFSGKKELFKDYWIGNNAPDYDWHKHPVIHLDFGGIGHGTCAELKESLCLALKQVGQQYGIHMLEGATPGAMLGSLVTQLSASMNVKVVLLVDEYDKPLVDHITNPVIAEANREFLSSFYSTVKGLEEYWRAIFITGVGKFSRTSLFSGMNNLFELTLDPVVADLFGYTYDELVFYYAEYIDEVASYLQKTREEMLAIMKEWYDGYRFSIDMEKPLMYNPLSILLFLNKKRIANYWFTTGTPTFLIPLLRLQGGEAILQHPIELSVAGFDAFDVSNISALPLLVQTGYLTIVNYDEATDFFTLDYPNREVRESFKNYLLEAFAYAKRNAIDIEFSHMRNALKAKNFTKFCDAVKTLFAGIPYNLHIARESYYHSLFHLMFDLLGMRPASEVASSGGRADLVIEIADSIIVFEFKHDASAQEALQQIVERKYYMQYMGRGKAIMLVGVAVNFRNKEIFFEWQEQTV